jgi:hypothetical protein
MTKVAHERRIAKTRYLSTGLAVLLAAAAAHPDVEHGAADAGGDPGVQTAAGGSGFRLAGAVLSFAAKSTPVSIGFGIYGASASIYSNFLSRGHDLVLPKDTSRNWVRVAAPGGPRTGTATSLSFKLSVEALPYKTAPSRPAFHVFRKETCCWRPLARFFGDGIHRIAEHG